MADLEALVHLIAPLTCSLILVHFGIPNSFIHWLCNYYYDYIRLYTQTLPAICCKILKVTCHAGITVDYYECSHSETNKANRYKYCTFNMVHIPFYSSRQLRVAKRQLLTSHA